MDAHTSDIAIVGMGGRFPGAPDLDTFWDNLARGVESITTFTDAQLRAAGVSPEELGNKYYVKSGTVVAGADLFDAPFFNLTPREAAITDPQHRVMLECAWEALEHAGYDSERFDGRIGVYVGASMSTYLTHLYTNPEIMESAGHFQVFLGNEKDHVATRVSYKLDLRGPSVTVQTACSTSLVAVHMACESLLGGQCDMALAGGVTIRVPQESGYWYQEGGLFSPDGHCRTFDAQAQGTVFGNGAGVVVLKRLADALDDNDTIYAVIKSSAINNDGALKVGYTAPSLEGQSRVIAEAQQLAGIDPRTIGYVEAHGTGTPLGDPIEVAALTNVFRTQTEERGFCAIGSVKSNIGHLDVAAGIAGLLKTALALRHGQLPPSLHFHTPNPQIDFAQTPFYVNTTLAPWPASSAPRRAGVSSFGIGGTNAHLILEEAPAPPPPAPARPSELLVLSARSPAALARAAERLAQHLLAHPELPLADVASTLQTGRRAFAHRLAFVCRTATEAAAILGDPASPRRRVSAVEPQRHSVAWLFPGQGAQHVGMGADLYAQEPAFRNALDRCAAVLKPLLGLDIRALIFQKPEQESTAERRTENGEPGGEARGERREAWASGTSGNSQLTTQNSKLTETLLAQPALFAVEYALAQLWLARGLVPQALLGHSLGEYVAATVAGVFSLEDALALVVARGKLMQTLGGGAMLAVALGEQQLLELLPPELALAAVNAPKLCVVAGPRERVAAFQARLEQQQISCRPLHVSQAFHSPLVEPILGAFRQQLQRVSRRAPQLPIASNLTGGWLTAAEATSVDYWVRQARQPVRFAEGLRTLEAGGASVLLEVGPGHSLSALARQQRSTGTVVQPSLPHPQEAAAAKGEGLWPALAGLWLAGVELDWSAGQAGRRRVPLPTYPFERQRFWVEPQPYHVLASAVRPARKPLAAWGHLPSWKRARPAGGARPQPPQHWIICHNGSPLGTRLAERLRQTDQAVTILDANDRAGYAAALAAAGPDKHPVVLSLWPPNEAPAAWLAQLSDWAGLLPEGGPGRLWAITSGAYAIESRDTGNAGQALVSGVAARLAGCLVRDVCGTDAADIEALLGEWRAADPEPLVVLRGRARWVPHWEPLPLPSSSDSAGGLRTGGVYALIGPLRGLGAALADRLAAEEGVRLIILTPADGTDAAPALAALRERGVKLWSTPIDLTDSGSIAAGLADGAQQAGALHGVISVLAVPPAAHRDPAVLDRVLGELRAVQAACAPLDLELRLACTAHPLLPGGPEQELALQLIAAAAETPPAGTAQPWLGICWDGRIDAPDTQPSAATLAPEELALSLRSTLAALAEGWIVLSPWDMDQASRHELPAGNTEEAAPAAAVLRAEDPPRTETERAIAAIWQTLLGIEPIGRSDDFFALGGHSLLATRALTRIRDLLHVELALDQFFAAPTVAALAAAAVQSTAAKQSLITRADRSRPLPPAFSQQRLWFLDQRAPHGTAYTIPAALRLGGQVDRAALEHALGALVERHESLRTTFAVIDGQLAQQIAPPHAPAGLPRLEVVDLQASDTETALARAGALAVEVAQRPFDLAAGPLLRVTLAVLGQRDHLLIIAMHHIISDAWSLGIVVRDLAALYQAAAAGVRAELPALPIQFADYAVWQRASLQGGQLQTELDYWRARLRGAPDLLHLPTDAPRPKTQSGRGAASTFLIDAPLRAALLEHSRAHDATLFITLLTGLQLLLAYLSGQEDICVGTAVAGRSHVETEALVGFFVNTLPLRTDLTGVADVPAALARVRETTLGAFAHQQTPFDLLVQELQIPRDSSRNPLFQVALVLQNAPMPTLELPGLVLRPWGLEQATTTARFDLLIDLTEQADGIAGVLEYATDLFQSASIARFAGLYQTLLAAIAADGGRSRTELHALLDAADRERQQQAATGIKEERRSRLKQITRKTLGAAPQPTSQGETHDVASDH